MVYNGKPYEQMDDLGGKHHIFGSTPICCQHFDPSNPKASLRPKNPDERYWDERGEIKGILATPPRNKGLIRPY